MSSSSENKQHGGRPKRDRQKDIIHLLNFAIYKSRKSEYKNQAFHLCRDYLRRHYGSSYKNHVIAPLLQDGTLEELRDGHYQPGKTCKLYRIRSLDLWRTKIEATLPNDYRELRDRTNLSEFTTAFYKEGENGDARAYSDYSLLAGTLKDQITIDNEATVEFDCANLWPLLLGKYIKAGSHFLTCCKNGALYDLLRDTANDRDWDGIVHEIDETDEFFRSVVAQKFVTREHAKEAVVRILNDPKPKLRVMGYFRTENDEIRTYQTSEHRRVKLAIATFEYLFPVEFRRFRELASRRLSYRIGSQAERRLREHILARCEEIGIDAILTAYDSFRIKVSDATAFAQIVSDIPVTIRRKAKRAP